jgi:pimeloyl-ACP methyl ester carboxylesterase
LVRILKGLAVVAILIYAGLCALLYLTQDSLLYHPSAEVSDATAEDLRLRHDGVTLKVWKAGDGTRAIVYFGGNAENVAFNIPGFNGAVADTATYFVNYRGYGGSTGSVNEQAMYRDAAFVFDYVQARHREVAVIGRSLGSGVAVWLASERPATRLVLVTPYDSIVKVAQSVYPFFPLALLMKDKFRAINRVSRIDAPVLILAASHDEVIPYGNTLALADAFRPGQVQVHLIPETSHNSISQSPDYMRAIAGFLLQGVPVGREREAR